MKIGLSNLLFVKSSPEEAVLRIAELGADCIEVIYDVPHFMPGHQPGQLGELKELIDSHGMEVSVHASFWDLNTASHYREVREFSIKQAKRTIEACERLGGKIVALHSGRTAVPDVDWFFEAAKRNFLESLEEISAHARERGVNIALENIGFPYFVFTTLQELGNLVEGRDDLGITLDVGHAFRERKALGLENPEQDLAETIRLLGKKITHLHFHDNRGERDEHLIPGKGSINFKPIVQALKDISYKGIVVVELFDPGNPLEAGRQGLEVTRKLLQR